jgi:hypothetical protein
MMARSEIIPDKCRCGSYLEKEWHLVCKTCWARLPENLRNEVYEAFVESRGSPRHMEAIRNCREHLRRLEPRSDNYGPAQWLKP